MTYSLEDRKWALYVLSEVGSASEDAIEAMGGGFLAHSDRSMHYRTNE